MVPCARLLMGQHNSGSHVITDRLNLDLSFGRCKSAAAMMVASRAAAATYTQGRRHKGDVLPDTHDLTLIPTALVT